ncbi:4910_t:CDS:1, partial [Racocetra fulgida]
HTSTVVVVSVGSLFVVNLDASGFVVSFCSPGMAVVVVVTTEDAGEATEEIAEEIVEEIAGEFTGTCVVMTTTVTIVCTLRVEETCVVIAIDVVNVNATLVTGVARVTVVVGTV